jgi:hypothetical protein
VEASWGVFCLEIVNFNKPIEEFDVSRSHGAPSLRTFVMVRDAEGDDAASRFYEAIGARNFDAEQDISQADTIKSALAEAGLDEGWYDKAIADQGTWDRVMSEHQALVADTRSFGVPTIRLDGGHGPAIFGPVISNPPASDDEATQLWEHVSWLTRYENFSEVKRDRTIDPDLNSVRTMRARRKAEAEAAEKAKAEAAAAGSPG